MDSKEIIEKYKQSLFKQERYEVVQEEWQEFMETVGVNEFQYGYAMFCSGSQSAWLYQQREIDALKAKITLLETKGKRLMNDTPILYQFRDKHDPGVWIDCSREAYEKIKLDTSWEVRKLYTEKNHDEL